MNQRQDSTTDQLVSVQQACEDEEAAAWLDSWHSDYGANLSAESANNLSRRVKGGGVVDGPHRRHQ